MLTRAFIERGPHGNLAYGRDCAIARFGSVNGIPDLTLHAEAGGGEGAGGRGGAGAPSPAADKARALRYLLLREELVNRYLSKPINHPQFAAPLAYYRANGDLAAADVALVLRVEAAQPPLFRLKNLLDVHAAHHLIDAMETSGAKSTAFKAGVLSYLHTKLRLTAGQLSALKLGMPSTAFG